MTISGQRRNILSQDFFERGFENSNLGLIFYPDSRNSFSLHRFSLHRFVRRISSLFRVGKICENFFATTSLDGEEKEEKEEERIRTREAEMEKNTN